MAKYNWKRYIVREEGIKIFHFPRRCGKTTALVNLVCADPKGILVTANRYMRDIIQNSFTIDPKQVKASSSIHGWDISSSRGCIFPKKNYYIDDAGFADRTFTYFVYKKGYLKALSFTNPSTSYTATETEIYSHKQILNFIIEKNKKSYYTMMTPDLEKGLLLSQNSVE